MGKGLKRLVDFGFFLFLVLSFALLALSFFSKEIKREKRKQEVKYEQLFWLLSLFYSLHGIWFLISVSKNQK